jgi:signal transduction histidine kinase
VRHREVGAWVTAMAAGLTIDLVVFGPQEVAGWIPDVAVGWAFLAGGLLLRTRAPQERIGLLMGWVGVAWFLGTLVPALVFLHRGALVHLLFGYPTGRLSRVGRVAVPAAYGVAVFQGVWGSEWTTIGLTVALLALVAVHRASAVGPLRRARQQATLVAVAVGVLLIGSALARLAFSQGDADRIALVGYMLALVAVAAAVPLGVLRGTWRTAPVTDLVVQLGGERSGAVRDALARALGDPSLEVGYRDGDGFVDAAGHPVVPPSGDVGRASTVVQHLGEPVAVLVHDPAVLTDAVLLDAVAAAARLAARNDGLRADVEARISDLEESRRRLVAAADAERGHLAERLVGGAEQKLAALADGLARVTTADDGISSVRAELDRTRGDLRRLAAGLDPVGAGGIEPALRDLAARCPIPVRIRVSGPPLAAEVAQVVWFVSGEAVANAVKHAGATRIDIHLVADDDEVGLTVADDGAGGADPVTGTGLRSLADRVDARGGRLRVQSRAGQGTTVMATLPLSPVS